MQHGSSPFSLLLPLHTHTQAFCLPIIQIVYETLRDRKAGKMGTAGGVVIVVTTVAIDPMQNSIICVPAGSEKVVLNLYDRGEMLGKCLHSMTDPFQSDSDVCIPVQLGLIPMIPYSQSSNLP